MWTVSFEDWIKTMRAYAKREGVHLTSSSDNAYYHYYDQGDTPLGAVSDIDNFGED